MLSELEKLLSKYQKIRICKIMYMLNMQYLPYIMLLCKFKETEKNMTLILQNISNKNNLTTRTNILM